MRRLLFAAAVLASLTLASTASAAYTTQTRLMTAASGPVGAGEVHLGGIAPGGKVTAGLAVSAESAWNVTIPMVADWDPDRLGRGRNFRISWEAPAMGGTLNLTWKIKGSVLVGAKLVQVNQLLTSKGKCTPVFEAAHCTVTSPFTVAVAGSRYVKLALRTEFTYAPRWFEVPAWLYVDGEQLDRPNGGTWLGPYSNGFVSKLPCVPPGAQVTFKMDELDSDYGDLASFHHQLLVRTGPAEAAPDYDGPVGVVADHRVDNLTLHGAGATWNLGRLAPSDSVWCYD